MDIVKGSHSLEEDDVMRSLHDNDEGESLDMLPLTSLSLAPLTRSATGGGGFNDFAISEPSRGIDWTDDSFTNSGREPPAVPEYLEPSYHYHSISNPEKLLNELIMFLDSERIDMVVKDLKFKVKCEAYRNGARLTFVARVFAYPEQLDKPRRYCVEFQRRSGDVMHFSEIYRRGKQQFVMQGLVEGEGPAEGNVLENSLFVPGLFDMQKGFAPLPFEDEVEEDESKETIKCLFEMAASECVDVQAKSIEALAELARPDKKIQHLILEEGGLSVIFACIDSKFEDVHRCGISGLANLTSTNQGFDNVSDAVCEEVNKRGLIPALCQMSCQSTTPEVVRECARALYNIGEHLGNNFPVDCHDSVEQLKLHSDDTVRTHAVKLMEAISC
jgi:hypothetical protein